MRGSRWGRGRGSYGVRGGSANSEEEKKLSEYVPAEPPTDEDTVFHSGITSGIHFNKYDTISVEVGPSWDFTCPFIFLCP